MGKVYQAPIHIKKPIFNYKDIKGSQADEDRYIAEIKAFCIERKKGKNVGEIIKFPAADGYALYMVANMKPLEYVHLDIGDAWSYQYIERLTVSDVNEQIRREKAINEMFAKRK